MGKMNISLQPCPADSAREGICCNLMMRSCTSFRSLKAGDSTYLVTLDMMQNKPWWDILVPLYVLTFKWTVISPYTH